MEVAVLGTGTIGSTVAYTLLTSGIDVRVTDVDENRCRGHSIDASHAMAHCAHAVGQGESGGTVTSVEPGPTAVDGADCVVVTASAERPSGANQRGGRTEWLEQNLAIVATIGEWFREVTPTPVVVVTNPLDVITYELYRQSGWPARCFLGYSLSETARVAHRLAAEFNDSPEAVSCPVLGEHGENIVPIFSRATIHGERVELDPSRRKDILEYVRDVPYTVMEQRGATESSRWVTGRGVALVARRILEGGVRNPVGLATPLSGEYGYSDVVLSVPLTVDERGVDEIVDWELSRRERARLDDAYRSVTAAIPE